MDISKPNNFFTPFLRCYVVSSSSLSFRWAIILGQQSWAQV